MRELIRLVSSAGTGHFYTTDKNKRTTPDKIEIKKFDPVVRKHVMYKEARPNRRAFFCPCFPLGLAPAPLICAGRLARLLVAHFFAQPAHLRLTSHNTSV